MECGGSDAALDQRVLLNVSEFALHDPKRRRCRRTPKVSFQQPVGSILSGSSVGLPGYLLRTPLDVDLVGFKETRDSLCY